MTGFFIKEGPVVQVKSTGGRKNVLRDTDPSVTWDGSYFTIPPQVQMEIASRKKIITDEYSGRILVDAELAEEEYTKINKMIKNI